MTQNIKEQLIKATQYALNNEWDAAHNIAQDYHHEAAYWLHAVLHKIEGDAENSHYWYAKTVGQRYERYAETTEELQAILQSLTA